MVNKNLKLRKKTKDSSPAEQQFGIFVEHMDKRFDQVLEGNVALDKKIDDSRHETRSEIRFINLNLSNASTNFKDLSVRVDRYQDETKKIMTDYFSAIDDELKQIGKELVAIKGRLSEKADRDYVATVEKRVMTLEGEIMKLKKS